MVRVLSFDIASKSLAWCVLEHNPLWLKDATEASSLEAVDAALDSAWRVLDWGVVDLLPGTALKDVDNLQRSRALRRELLSLDKWRTDTGVVLLEYQMSANYNANAVYNQILFHFCGMEVETLSPTLKNKVKLGAGLGYQDFAGRYSNAYTANKNHTKANMLHYSKVFNRELPPGIAAKNKDDLADAFMQAVWWCTHCHSRPLS